MRARKTKRGTHPGRHTSDANKKDKKIKRLKPESRALNYQPPLSLCLFFTCFNFLIKVKSSDSQNPNCNSKKQTKSLKTFENTGNKTPTLLLRMQVENLSEN
jgi:hypothetical protein